MNSRFRIRNICITGSRFPAFAAIAALAMTAVLPLHSNGQGAAQGPPNQGMRIGNVYIPPCSIGHPGDGFSRMHTNFQILMNPLFGLPGGIHFDSSPPPPFAPANLQQIYFLPSTGGSQIIAVVDAYHFPTALNDFNVFSAQWGLPTEPSSNATASTNKVFQVLYASGTQPGTDPAGPGGWDIEEALDIEWAHAMAPNAKIILVECTNNSGQNLLNGNAAATLYTDTETPTPKTVREISNSWGSGEFSGESFYDTYFNSTSAAYFCSAGDSGAPAQWPSASAFVISAGGTTVNVNSSNVLLSEVAWNSGGGGPSAQNARPFYQAGVASVVGTQRGTPDISYDANPNTGVYVYDSYAGGWYEVGGTSLSSPALAGIANVAATTENGFPAGSQALLTNIYTNYANFYTGSPGDVFRDITSGNNGHPALTGWDFVTGVGSCRGVPAMWDIGTPSASSQSVSVAHNSGGTTVTLSGSDPDSPALPIIYTTTSSPAHGSLTGTVPNLTYKPNTGYYGSDTFTFTVTNTYSLPTSPVITDQFYTSSTATVTLNVAAGVPTASAQSVNVSFNTSKGITLTGSDAEDSPPLSLTYAIGATPSHGSLSGTAPNVTYTPNTGFNGADTFTFTVSNGTNTSAPATVTLTVAAGTPNGNGQSSNVGHNAPVGLTLTGSDPDVPPLPITFAIATNPSNGALSGFNATTGAVTYTPTANYHGSDSFTFTVNNGSNTSAPATVSLTVAVGTPTANSQSVSTNQETAKAITLTGSDADLPALSLTYAIATSPANGVLTGTAPNVTYTPNLGFYGSDSFTFTVSNGTNTSAAATVSITVVQTLFDVSGQVSVTRGPLLYNRANGHYQQVLTLTNTGGTTVTGPISVILGSLANATLADATGVTSVLLPAGRPYINPAGSLAPGASTTVTLLFTYTGPGSITYSTQVVAGAGSR